MTDLPELKRNVVLRPMDPEVRFALAEALFSGGDAAAAVQQAQKALELQPDHWNARRLAARALAKEGRLGEAERLLAEPLARAPGDPRAADELTEFFASLERPTDAAVWADVAHHLVPEDVGRRLRWAALLCRNAQVERALFVLEAAGGQTAELRGARAELRRVLGLPQSAAVLELPAVEQLGAILASEEVRSLARSAGLEGAFAAAAGQDPGGLKRALVLVTGATHQGFVRYVRGELLLAAGDGPGAEAALQASGLPVAQVRLGDLALRRGEAGAARERYQRARAAGSELAAERLATLAQRERVAERDQPAVGRIGVLGWAPRSGLVSPLQALAVVGRGLVQLSGNAGPESREAADIAFTCLRARALQLRVDALVRGFDLHLHFDDTECAKDGLSAGLAMALAAVSAYTQRPLAAGLAATGALSLMGEVRRVEGLREKLTAAFVAGARRVLYPRANHEDVEALPEVVRRRVRFVAVDTLEDALESAQP